jgi:hypothetical protein
MSMKSPLTPAEIEPATFRFVVQHLKHCATAVPAILKYLNEISTFELECLVERLILINGLNWLCSMFVDEI